MVEKNTSDIIEDYIKKLLEKSSTVELKRSHVADVFQVVPSQINYVIKTRFTESRGYLVESKRGGGGYIRIARQRFSDQHQLLKELIANRGEQLTYQVFADLILYLHEEKWLNERDGQLMLSLATDDILGHEAQRIRAKMLRKLLLQLDRKE